MAETNLIFELPTERFDLSKLIDLASDTSRLNKVESRGRRCHWCARPVRLRVQNRTANRKNVLYKACGSRDSTRCPSCSRLYQGDARQIMRSGLRGGKGIPETIGDHPAVFATFTAPSFGSVHRVTAVGHAIGTAISDALMDGR